MMASSRRTTCESKSVREISPLRMKPVSYVMPFARTCLVLSAEWVRPETIQQTCVHASLLARNFSGMLTA